MIPAILILPSNRNNLPPRLAVKFAFRAEAAFGAAPGAAVVVARRAEWVVTDPGACPLRAAAEFFLLRFGFLLFGWILLGDERGRAFFPEAAAAFCMPVPEVSAVLAADGPAFTPADPVSRVSFFAVSRPTTCKYPKSMPVRSTTCDISILLSSGAGLPAPLQGGLPPPAPARPPVAAGELPLSAQTAL